jgi:PadR family transcriptional regulator, regulatory protein PadR
MSISKLKPVRDVLLAFARVHILHHASEERIFGVGMMEELGRHGYQLGPGTLYPLLRRLQSEGLLAMQTEVVDGKMRKYYTITGRGRAALQAIRPKLAELADEVLPDGARPAAGHRKRQGTAR